MERKIYATKYERDLARRHEQLKQRYIAISSECPGRSANWYCTVLAGEGVGGLYSRSQVRRVLEKEGIFPHRCQRSGVPPRKA